MTAPRHALAVSPSRRTSVPRLLSALLLLFASACHGPGDGPDGCEGTDCPSAHGLADTFEHGTLSPHVVARDGYGGLKVRVVAGRAYVLETTRDREDHASRRLTVESLEGGAAWRFQEQPGEHFSDFTVHPSGEVTLGVERTGAARDGFDLVRLSVEGSVVARQPLPEPTTLPTSDLGGDLPPSPFRMKSRETHALTDGWLRTEARGEDVTVAFLSLMTVPEGQPTSPELVSGAMSLQWTQGRYAEQWTRIVDGRHSVQPAAWAYDEFRWREAPLRPLLAVGEDGTVVVGRTWSTRRCLAVSRTFQEVPASHCYQGEDVGTPVDTEYQPFAFTSFSPTGAREGTRVFVPSGAAEFVVFDMALRGTKLALAGTSVRTTEAGTVAYYPAEPGAGALMTPYDAYVAVLDRPTGALLSEHHVDEGRADHFSALRWTDEGLLAVGASGWDRWYGGMSISRGAGPLLALVSPDGRTVRTRRPGLDGQDRHFHLLGVDVRGDGLLAVGLAEAPMTHSGDGGNTANMTFGGLTVDLR